MDTKNLITEFKNWDLRNLLEYADLLSTRTDDLSSKPDESKFFPPYIPFIGKYYEKYKMLIYATAQNIDPDKDNKLVMLYSSNFDKLVERLYYSPDFERKYLQDSSFDFTDIAIHPYQAGVLPALAGIFIYAMDKQKIADFNEIQNHIAVSNYYKFSLHKQRDINPNNLESLNKYRELNHELVLKELRVLEPTYIITFQGSSAQFLEKQGFEVITINDPAWILRGGGGCLKKDGSWGRSIAGIGDQELTNLVDTYSTNLKSSYQKKKDSVKIYLLKYYLEWQKIFQKNT